ncbi:hypothetical protein P7C71_g1402, partial [Lecanoromycetidae sp. Uapishka_2]
MADDEGLLGLRGLHQDLLALEDSRLRNIDRLWAELEARVNEFRQLLDKPAKNDANRKTLETGTINVDEEEYSVNKEFQETAIQLAEILDLDELASARLLLESQQDAEVLARSNVASAIILFHEHRQFLLECLRLLLKKSMSLEVEEDVCGIPRQLVSLILETKDGPARNGSLYAQKCMGAMAGIEKWLQSLADHQQGMQALGQTLSTEAKEIMEFQQQSLGQQHESLGAIVQHLVKGSYTGVEDFYKVLEHMPKLDRLNNLALHYIPTIVAFTAQCGSSEGSASLREARALNSKILDHKDSAPWALRDLQAATITWWLAEYTSRYLEAPTGSPLQNVDLEAEARARSEAFFQALQDNAFQCTLSICVQATPDEWHDPTRNGLINSLLQDYPALSNGLTLPSPYFRTLLMEQFESFADAFITSMPDTLRRFKSEEDTQRVRSLFPSQPHIAGHVTEQSFHLERFFLIISFAFDQRDDAAQAFWSDPDSNLYGFLQWASRRQSTPCIGAFCEMLRSICPGEECAAAAHRFLLEENTFTSAKMRRLTSLSWSQIFEEINIFTARNREQPSHSRSVSHYASSADNIVEPESSYMLENYLRLMAHLCSESAEVRLWILSQADFPILEGLFHLCNAEVPGNIHACAFTVVRALLTDKSNDLGMAMWSTLDQWISGKLIHNSSVLKSVSSTAIGPVKVVFDTIASDFEQAKDFVGLLHSLVAPSIQSTDLNDQLPFPEALGAAYRMPGIEPYVDFVFGKVFASITRYSEEPQRRRILTWNVLNFAVVCLDTFNEDLVVLANRSKISVDEAMNTSSLLTYVRLHPYSRVMEWMFNDRVLAALFASSHHDVDEVASASPDSPLILSLICSINVLNLVMDLQSTYLDLVRPLIKLQSVGRREPVSNPSLASLEDSVALNLELIADLGLYAGVGNQDLTVASLKLLGKLASSRKLNTYSTWGQGQTLHRNRLISIVEQHDDLDRIARSLSLAMQFDVRELGHGKDAPSFTTKSVILDFLLHCLSASLDRPTLAHAFLGFCCKGTALDVEANSLFADGSSLFHAVLHLAVAYPDGDEGTMQAWSLGLKQKAMQVLCFLWTSPLSSIFTMSELRSSDFLFALFLRQSAMGPTIAWDGRLTRDPDFMFTESAEALEHYLWQRCSLLEYTSSEVRLVAAEGVPSLKARIFSTLLGSTSTPEGEQIPNLTIFDLFDFVELDIGHRVELPPPIHFASLDFSVCVGAGVQPNVSIYDIKVVHEMITLRLNELRRSGHFQDPNEELRAGEEAQQILLFFRSENSRVNLTFARLQTMKAWADLLTLAIGTCELDVGAKASLILQALQVVTPKLEEYAMTNAREAVDVAKLILALLFQLDFETSTLDQTRAGDTANDRLFQVFRTGLRAINGPQVDVYLREVLYKICYRYLSGMAQASAGALRHRQVTRTVKTTGEKTMDIVCDDAYGASGTCRISALLLLDALAGLAEMETSNFITSSLMRTNFVQVLVESIENIPHELRESSRKGKYEEQRDTQKFRKIGLFS